MNVSHASRNSRKSAFALSDMHLEGTAINSNESRLLKSICMVFFLGARQLDYIQALFTANWYGVLSALRARYEFRARRRG